MKVRYIGASSDGVELAATGQYAAHGTPIEVPDDLGASLCQQASWEQVAAKAAKAEKE